MADALKYVYTADTLVDSVPRHGPYIYASLFAAKQACQRHYQRQFPGEEVVALEWEPQKETHETDSWVSVNDEEEYAITRHELVY